MNPMKGRRPIALPVLAAAGVLMAGTALAAPRYDNTDEMRMQPQAAPMQNTQMNDRAAPYGYGYEANDGNYRYPSATTGMRTDVAEVINPGNIRYLSGGIGQDEQMMLKQAEADYPVKVVFANTNGAYMSDVNVTVKDASGATVLKLVTDGPVLLMDLKPGAYTLSADDGGQVKSQKLNVSDSNRTYTLHFKTAEPLGYNGQAG